MDAYNTGHVELRLDMVGLPSYMKECKIHLVEFDGEVLMTCVISDQHLWNGIKGLGLQIRR